VSRLKRVAPLIVGGLIVGLILGEIVLRLVLPRTGWMRVPFEQSAPVLQVSSSPVLGYELRPGAVWKRPVERFVLSVGTDECSMDVQPTRVHIEINRHGFRGEDWSDTPAEGTTRIAVLGDSQTLAEGVDLPDTFPAQLERHLTARAPETSYEVLNYGVLGYNAEQELVILRDRVLPQRPDVVLLDYVSNDPELDRAAVFFYPTTANPLTRSVVYKVILHGIRLRHRHIRDLAFHSPTYQQFAVWLHEDGPYWDATLAILLRMRDACWDQGVGFGIVLFPDLFGQESFDPELYEFEPVRQRILSLADEGIPVIDPIPALEAFPCAPEQYRTAPDDLHFGGFALGAMAGHVAGSPELAALLAGE